ncbi:MAG: hypothetical protein F4Z06_03310 [Acidimicrobiia bacterium]|nr:hypothetical protein [Acidimicrobiia bacterium]MYB11457.1 hypothetical protein [Acidimicrobiia bacterium]MYE73310.1 hypothetical protein [Acidimicrobiia bacterium]MYG59618.1 hypothetical protein [Acidimicrobiia bacterium]MYJ31032.1 hypothetical protein [Acidimicrobiia bacterium]
MEPNPGDKRLEDVSASDPDGIDRSLPAPPSQSPSIPEESPRRPRNRVFIPAAVLVVVLPIAVWHLLGQRDYVSDPVYSLKAPSWLSELPHPVGLLAVTTVLAAIGWLVVEYWLRGWHQWWFVALGAFCLMGIYTAVGGREGTAGLGRPDPGDPGWPNVYGWAFVLAAPVVYGALLMTAGEAIHKINPAYIAAFKARTRIKSNFLLGGLLLVPGLLVLLVAIAWRFFSEPSIDTFLVEIVGSIIFTGFFMILLSPFYLVKAVLLIAGMITAWFVLFGSADAVLRRKSYW